MKKTNYISSKSFLKDTIIKRGFLFAFLFTLAAISLLAYYYSSLPPQAPLFFSVARGEQQLTNKQFLLMLPILSLTFLITHIWLAKINYTNDKMFSRIMSVTATMVTFLFMIALLHIILIVT